jgi:hypothetical protein
MIGAEKGSVGRHNPGLPVHDQEGLFVGFGYVLEFVFSHL